MKRDFRIIREVNHKNKGVYLVERRTFFGWVEVPVAPGGNSIRFQTVDEAEKYAKDIYFSKGRAVVREFSI